MRRRQFLRFVGVNAAAAGLSAPAIAQSNPPIRWRLASSAPKSLETVLGTAEYVAKRVEEATDRKFQIQTFASDEIVPQFQVSSGLEVGRLEHRRRD